MKILLFFLYITTSYSFFQKNYIDRAMIACKYNQQKILKIINSKKNDFDVKLTEKELDKVYKENFSDSSSNELIDLLKDNTFYIFEINTEYLFFITLILSEILKFSLNEFIIIKTREEWIRVIIKNVIIPVIIHDSIKLSFNFIKNIFISLHQ
jgi:hypothetical protein